MGICSRVLTVMSTIISEIPLIVVCTVLYYLLGYLPYSKQGGPPVRAIMYTVGVLLLQIYSVTISVAISAIFPTLDICTKVLSALMLVFITANGTIVEYRSMSLIAQYLLHWANPGRWFMGSMLASGSEDIVLDCELIPAYVFSPPPNTTCGDYMKPYFDRINPGKILNPLSYSACVLCPVSSENDYLRTFGYFDKSFIYRDMAIYCVFIIVNIVIALLAAKYVEYTKR